MNEEDININIIKQDLLRTNWVEEAKQIPLENCTKEEQQLLLKCINKEEFTATELTQLEKLLGRYRSALEKYEPLETLDNYERNVQLVQDEKSILSRMREAREEQVITMLYPLSQDETLELQLLVMNEIDAEALDDLQQNLELFADLSENELDIYQRYAHDQPQSREERAIAEQIEQKLREKSTKNIPEMRKVAIKFLAKQTRLYNDKNSTEQGMTEIYEEMKLGYLLALFEKVQGMTGVSNIDTENLFR